MNTETPNLDNVHIWRINANGSNDFRSSAYMRRFSYFGVCADVCRKLHIGIRNLRIYASGGRLEFLHIGADFLLLEFLQTYTCADFHILEFVQTFAESSTSALGICASMQVEDVWSFCI